MNRQEIIHLISDHYKVNGEALWKKFPSYLVFRNYHSNKWFAIIMDSSAAKLNLNSSDKVTTVLNSN